MKESEQTMSLINSIIRPEILAQSSYYVADTDNMPKDLVKLDAMENPYGLPDSIKVELGAHLAQVALNRYPVPSYRALKQKIAQQFGIPAGFDVTLGNGSDELISMITWACAKPAAKVLAPVPTFVMYALSAQLAGVEFIGVPLRADLSLDLPAMLAAIEQHQPALVFLANPNNPTGSWFTPEQIVQVINAMANIGLVVIDEAYQPFAPGSMMLRLPEFANLVVMRTVSKLGLAGLRLGYMSASAALLTEFEKVRPPYNVNVLTQGAMEFLLDHMPVFEAQASQICEQRTALITALQKLPNVWVFPSDANFILIKVPDASGVFNKLFEQKVLVKNVSKMHDLLTNCLRITVGSPAENKLFIDVLCNSLSNQ